MSAEKKGGTIPPNRSRPPTLGGGPGGSGARLMMDGGGGSGRQRGDYGGEGGRGVFVNVPASILILGCESQKSSSFRSELSSCLWIYLTFFSSQL